MIGEVARLCKNAQTLLLCQKMSSMCDVQVGTATEMGIATTVVETTDVAKGRFTPEVRARKGCLYMNG